MRNEFEFTTEAVEAFGTEADDGQPFDRVAFDTMRDCRHLGIRVRRKKASGPISRSWVFWYPFAGKTQKTTLAPLAQLSLHTARQLASDKNKLLATGTDPCVAEEAITAAAVETRACPLFPLQVAQFIKDRRATKKGRKGQTISDDTLRARRLYLEGEQYFGTCFNRLRLNQITPSMVEARLQQIETSISPISAQRARAALHGLFASAMPVHVKTNPVAGTREPMPKMQQVARDRVLSNDEIVKVWQDAAERNDEYGKLIRLALLLGSRRSEVGGMRWSEISGDTWTIPGNRTKNRRALMLPLPPLALAIINSVPRKDGQDELIFGSRSKDGFTSWSTEKRKMDERVALAEWTFHDLRRTAATGMHEIGIAPHVVEMITSHRDDGGYVANPVHARHYNHASYDAPKREALRTWAEHLGQLVGANVIQLAA